MNQLQSLLEMIRFSHTIFALPFALLAAVMAWTLPVRVDGVETPLVFRPLHLLGILLCMVFARSAAMAFNRIVDRDVDARNPRTAGRHLPAGLLSLRAVVTFTLLCAGAFVASTLLFLPNWLPIALSVPVLAFLLAYSLTKRFTAAAHFWLGAALMLTPICAWIALRGHVVLQQPADLLPAVWLGLAVLLWVSGFDMIYSCQDEGFDRGAKLKSVPAKFGTARALQLAAGCHLAMLLILVSLPWIDRLGAPPLPLGLIYGTGVAVVTVLLVYEHSIVRPDDLTRVNRAFFQVNAVVSMGLFLVTSLDLIV